MYAKPATIAFSIISVLSLLVTVPVNAEWQGTIVTEDGASVVRNPESAMGELTIDLEEEWRRGDEDDDMFFGIVSDVIEGPDGKVYVLDSQVSEIHIYSKSGEFLRTIGREGEGPGEFRSASDMYFGPGGVIGVMSIFPGKIVRMQPDGSPEDNFPLPVDEGGGFQLCFKVKANAERVVISGARQTQGGTENAQLNYLKAFDKDGKELAVFHEYTELSKYGGMKYDEKIFANFKGQWTLAPDGRVAAVLSFDDYLIHVWNSDGTLSHIIERPDYPVLARTGEQKERFQALYDGVTQWNPNSSFKISETHRAIYRLYYQPDGSLWVMSGRGVWDRGDGVFAAFDVYDREGRFMTRVELRGDGDPENDGIFFGDGRLYLVTELMSTFMAQLGGDTEADEEAEPLQLVAYTLDTSQIGMNE